MVAERRKLLLADDSPTIRKVVSLTFSDEGMEVVAVGTGGEAVRQLEENTPDVVLADVHMPGLGGYELCERIKADARYGHIPVVLLVGAFEPFSEAEARRVGADGILTKPFQSIRELVGKVGSLFGGKQSGDDTPAAADDAPRRDEAAASNATATEDARQQTYSTPDARADEAPAYTSARADGGDAPPASDARSTTEAAPSFNDFDMDDRMIEARPAEASAAREETAASASAYAAAEVESPRASQSDEAAFNARDFTASDPREFAMSDQSEFAVSEPHEFAVSEPRESTAAPETPEFAASVQSAGAGASAAEPLFTKRFANAAAADDALLDLGSVEPPPAAAYSDDFVLDLDDESPASFSTSTRPTTERAAASFPFGGREAASSHDASAGASSTGADAAGAFAEAAHGAGAGENVPSYTGGNAPAYEELTAEVSREESAGGESAHAPRDFIEPRVVPSEEPVQMNESAIGEPSVEGDIPRPPLEATPYAEAARPAEAAPSREAESADDAAPARQLDAGQFTPEVIEAIARRAVEMLSERVVRDVAWEVVPELAERLIKQRLDEIAQK